MAPALGTCHRPSGQSSSRRKHSTHGVIRGHHATAPSQGRSDISPSDLRRNHPTLTETCLTPVDRLHLLRLQIKILEAEAQEIREQIMSGEVGRVGDYYTANITSHVRLKEKPKPIITD